MAQVIKRLKSGRPVIVVDDSTRENEGDLVVAAQLIDEFSTNFMIKHSSGVICLATTKEQLQKLKLSKVTSLDHTRDNLATPFALSCEAKHNIGTGISAVDRSISLHVIANPNSTPKDIVVPGHIFPLEAHSQGLKGRQGHTEAAVELCKLANLWPAAAIAELPHENGGMLSGDDLQKFARTYDIPLISIAEMAAYQATHSSSAPALVTKAAEANLPTVFGKFRISVWPEEGLYEEHVVLSLGELQGAHNVPLRLHSQCLTGDVFHSTKCDCGTQLARSLEYIAKRGFGMLIWLRQEGRGIGLINKIKAYHLQDTQNLNTIEANLALNLPEESRDFRAAAAIVKSFAPSSIDLLTNNPLKLEGLCQYLPEIPVKRLEIFGAVTKDNVEYLKTKKNKMKHMLKL